LIERHTIAEDRKALWENQGEIRKLLAEGREKIVFHFVARRPRPHLDDKIIAAWNGLNDSCLFARGAQVLDEPRYWNCNARRQLPEDKSLWRKSKLLYRNYRGARSDIEGFRRRITHS